MLPETLTVRSLCQFLVLGVDVHITTWDKIELNVFHPEVFLRNFRRDDDYLQTLSSFLLRISWIVG